MTRAEEIAENTFWEMEKYSSFKQRRAILAAALESYAKEERERCAKIAEQFGGFAGVFVAARIREGQ